MATFYRRHTCRICEEKSLIAVLPLENSAMSNAYSPEKNSNNCESYPLVVCLCKQCGNVQLHDVVRAEDVYTDYLYCSELSPGLSAHFKKYASDVVERLLLKPSQVVVDLGCNDGVLLGFFAKYNLRLIGVEPAKKAADMAVSRGASVYNDYLDQSLAQKIVAAEGKVHLVTANNVMANIDELNNFVAAIKTLLASEGTFVFESGSLLSLIEHCVFDNIYHEHLSYFSVSALKFLFKRHDMTLFHVDHVDTKGGSIRGFVRNNTFIKEDSTVQAYIDRENQLKIFDKGTYRQLHEKLDKIKKELHAFIDAAEARKETVAGYGASHSVTTVLYQFDLGRRLSFLVDDNSKKQGTWSPGFLLPVFLPEEIYHRKINNVIILPWRFSDLIVKNHQQFLELGGKFINFLPSFEVLSQ